MIVSIIAALDLEGGIGKNNEIPWKLKDDQQRFKRITMGHFIIMGRKTFESIGKPLPGRTNIVISRSPSFNAPGCIVSSSLDEALSIAGDDHENEVFIIGGSEIYSLSIKTSKRMYLTFVQTTAKCDVFFPKYKPGNWFTLWSVYQPADENNQFASIFKYMVRKID